MSRTWTIIGWIALTVTALLLAGVVVLAFGPLPRWLVDGSGATLVPLSAPDRLKAETDTRSALLQAVAGILLVLGGVTAWRQMLVNRSQYRLSRRIATTEAFAKSLEQLGGVSESIRLGAIYALDRVVSDDPLEETRVSEILTTYAREYPERSTEFSAIVQILSRREWSCKHNLAGLDFSAINLRNTVLSNSTLDNAIFAEVDLSNASLRGARVGGADFRRAILHGTDLRATALDQATLSGARDDKTTRWPSGFNPSANGIIRD